MRTTKYKALSRLSQVLCILGICAAVLALIHSLLYYYLIDVEENVTSDFLITFYSFGMAMLSGTVVIGLLGACSATSGNKVFMGFFNRVAVVSSIILGCFLGFFHFVYMAFLRSAMQQFTTPNQIAMALPTRLQGRPYKTIVGLVQQDFEFVINVYVLCQSFAILMFLLTAIIVHYIKRIKLYEEQAMPTIVVSKNGMNTAALAERKFVAVAS